MSIVEIAGNRFAVIDEGTGTPIVFVHGFPLSSAMWKHQLAEFQTTHRVIIPDLRGFGESTTSGQEATSLAMHADDLAALLDRLVVTEPIVLCGLSMGGYVAFRFWQQHAKRVRALILCDTKATADTEEAAKNRLAMADRVIHEGSQIAADAMLPKLFDAATPQSVIDETYQVMRTTNPRTVAAAQRAMAARPDSTPLLKTITVPTLVIAGAEDQLIKPDEMQAMAAAIPNSQFVTIPHAGHMAPLEQPAAVNAAIQTFLQSRGC